MCDAQNLRQIRQPFGTSKHPPSPRQTNAKLGTGPAENLNQVAQKDKGWQNTTLHYLLSILMLLEANQRDLGHTLPKTYDWTWLACLANKRITQ